MICPSVVCKYISLIKNLLLMYENMMMAQQAAHICPCHSKTVLKEKNLRKDYHFTSFFSPLSSLSAAKKWVNIISFFLLLIFAILQKLNRYRHFILLTNTFLKQSINIVDIRAILKVIILWIKEKMLHNFCIMVFTLNSRDLNCFYSVIFPLDKWLMLTGMP